MKQISSKLNIYIQSISVINNNIERFILHIIFLSFGILAFSYVLLLGNMVRNIVERQSFEARVRSLTNEVRNLEVTYLSMSSGVDLDLSYSMGFKNTQTTFATRKALGFGSASASKGNVKTAPNDL